MANRKEKQFWLHEDKVSFETIENHVNYIKNYHLSSIQLLTTITESKNNTNDKDKYSSIYEDIKNAKSELNSIMTKLSEKEKTINKNLKNKKINAFKNFIIRFFTFGKINRNKNIESEISNFKSDCQKLKDKIKDIDQKLDEETSNFLTKIGQKHILLEKQLTEYEAKNNEKENKNQAYQKEIGELQQELENQNQAYQKKIDELQQVNIQYQKIQAQHNDKYVNKFISLESMVRERDEEIKILKQNQELETKKELTDSGNESDSNTSNFNKDQINTADSTEKKISTGILKFLKLNI